MQITVNCIFNAEIIGFRAFIKSKEGCSMDKLKMLKKAVFVTTAFEIHGFKEAKAPYYRKKYPESEIYIDLLIRFKDHHHNV